MLNSSRAWSLQYVLPLALVFLGACASMREGEAPDVPQSALSMPDVPDVPIHPTKVTVKNGRGETLLDGTPGKDYRLTGNSPPSKFDGSLAITTDYDNGTSRTQTLTHDPAQRVNLAWNESLNEYVVANVDAPTPADTRIAEGEGGWAIQAFVDYKTTPYKTTSVTSSGSPLTGSPDLSDTMGRVHATRINVSVFSDERSGGGPFNQFSSSQWLFGPTLGGRIAVPLFLLGGGSPVLGFLQYKAMLMDDVSHSGVSPFTSNIYSLRADGSIQHKVMFGIEKRF